MTLGDAAVLISMFLVAVTWVRSRYPETAIADAIVIAATILAVAWIWTTRLELGAGE